MRLIMALEEQIAALDVELFSFVPIQAIGSDARALLALHAAVVAAKTPFTYLEIGSYRGGSLQVLIRDPRCTCVMSIDLRTAETPDETRGDYTYEENTTERMVELLSRVPDADLSKLATFDTTTQELSPTALPQRPDWCFIDGEHSDHAVLADARFCADALAGTGVIAFHDWGIVRSAIKEFVRERRRDISFALAINRPVNPSGGHGVFAVELGDRGILQHPAVARATGTRSHQIWRLANRARSVRPVFLTWDGLTAVDAARTRSRLRR